MSDYPYEEFTLITDRLDNADRKIKKLEQELEAMWAHIRGLEDVAKAQNTLYTSYAVGKNDFVIDPRFMVSK